MIGYVTLGLEEHFTYSCEPFERRVGLLMSCRAGGMVAADVSNVKMTCSSTKTADPIRRIVKLGLQVLGFYQRKVWVGGLKVVGKRIQIV